MQVGHAARPSEQKAALAALAVLLAEREEREQKASEEASEVHELWRRDWNRLVDEKDAAVARAVAAEAERERQKAEIVKMLQLVEAFIHGDMSVSESMIGVAVQRFITDEEIEPPVNARAIAAEAELVTLRAALDFYADERVWERQPTPDAERGYYPEHVPAVTDGGDRARAVLAGGQREVSEPSAVPAETLTTRLSSADTDGAGGSLTSSGGEIAS